MNKRGNLALKGKPQVTPQSTNQALANLMTAGQPIIDTDRSGIVSTACDIKDMKPHCTLEYGGFLLQFRADDLLCYRQGRYKGSESVLKNS